MTSTNLEGRVNGYHVNWFNRSISRIGQLLMVPVLYAASVIGCGVSSSGPSTTAKDGKDDQSQYSSDVSTPYDGSSSDILYVSPDVVSSFKDTAPPDPAGYKDVSTTDPGYQDKDAGNGSKKDTGSKDTSQEKDTSPLEGIVETTDAKSTNDEGQQGDDGFPIPDEGQPVPDPGIPLKDEGQVKPDHYVINIQVYEPATGMPLENVVVKMYNESGKFVGEDISDTTGLAPCQVVPISGIVYKLELKSDGYLFTNTSVAVTGETQDVLAIMMRDDTESMTPEEQQVYSTWKNMMEKFAGVLPISPVKRMKTYSVNAFPVKVYVPEHPNKEQTQDGFDAWYNTVGVDLAANPLLTQVIGHQFELFKYVDSADKADIVVYFDTECNPKTTHPEKDIDKGLLISSVINMGKSPNKFTGAHEYGHVLFDFNHSSVVQHLMVGSVVDNSGSYVPPATPEDAITKNERYMALFFLVSSILNETDAMPKANYFDTYTEQSLFK